MTEAPFGRCCPQITVAAMMMSSAADLTVSFSSNSQGTAVSHVYGFQAAEGGCVCTDTVEITNVPPCSSCIVVPIARRSHTRTMDALAERFSGSHPAPARYSHRFLMRTENTHSTVKMHAARIFI